MERLAFVALDLFRRAILVAPFSDAGLRARLREKRKDLHGYLESLRALRADDTKFWQDAAATLPTPPNESAERRDALRAWAHRAAAAWSAQLEAPLQDGYHYSPAAIEQVEYGITGTLVAGLADLRLAVELGAGAPDPLISRQSNELGRMLETLMGPAPSWVPGADHMVTERRFLQRLLAAEVSHVALTGESPPLEQEVLLMQVSADTRHLIGGPGLARKKLAGVTGRALRGLLQEELAGQRLDVGEGRRRPQARGGRAWAIEAPSARPRRGRGGAARSDRRRRRACCGVPGSPALG